MAFNVAGSGFFYIAIMDKTVAKKMTYDSPEFKESNLWIVEGTAEYLLRVIWETKEQLMALSNGDYDFKQPLRKDVVRKFHRNEFNELVEI
jgi:hypothetical protein